MNIKIQRRKQLLLLVLFMGTFALPSILNNQNLFGLANTIAIVFMLFTSQEYVERSYYYFVRIIAVTMMLSLIVWVMVGVGVPLSAEVIDPLNELKKYNYLAYPFLVISLDYTGTMLDMLRFEGMFDEPGVIGTVSLLILSINRFNLRKWYNLVCFIGGVLSMSLFFYIGTMLYVLLMYILNKQYSISRRVVGILLLFLGFIVMINNDTTSELILGRMQYDKTTNKISGDNRSDVYLDNYIDNIRGSSSYYWGVRNNSVIQEFAGSAGYKNAILMYGIVFIALYIILMSIYGSIYIYKDKWLYFTMVFIMIITLYQRPGFMNKDFIFLFMCLFRINCSDNENKVYKTI